MALVLEINKHIVLFYAVNYKPAAYKAAGFLFLQKIFTCTPQAYPVLAYIHFHLRLVVTKY